jgi:hypothetical protein
MAQIANFAHLHSDIVDGRDFDVEKATQIQEVDAT